jgi:Ca-activated chloride channel homolog
MAQGEEARGHCIARARGETVRDLTASASCRINMMRRCFVLVLLLQLALWAQRPAVFRVNVNVVTVPVTVMDQHGVAVMDLKPDEFRLYDEGARQEISNVWLDAALPLYLGVVMDASDSQRRLIRQHEATTEKFLARIIRPQDRAFVVRVNENVNLMAEVFGRPDGLHRRMLPATGEPLGEPCATLHGHSLCGGTVLWDAVHAAASLELRRAAGSKALLILSDGNDTKSSHSLAAALDEAQRADATVYAIRYPDPAAARAEANGLSLLCDETGGVVFSAARTDLTDVLARVEADLRSRYILAFRPTSLGVGNEPHRLRVEVTRPGLTVRARKSYLTAPE